MKKNDDKNIYIQYVQSFTILKYCLFVVIQKIKNHETHNICIQK